MDFGLSKLYKDKDNNHIKFSKDKNFVGTPRYGSVNAHLGYELSRRDDLESIAYVLMLFIAEGRLPWSHIKVQLYNNNQNFTAL